MQGFPGGSEVKASACNVGDLGSISGLGRSPGEGNGNPLQYSCLENPMYGGAWWATVHGVAESRTRLSDFTHGVQVASAISKKLIKRPWAGTAAGNSSFVSATSIWWSIMQSFPNVYGMFTVTRELLIPHCPAYSLRNKSCTSLSTNSHFLFYAYTISANQYPAV